LLHEEEEEEEEEDLFSALRERIFRLIINELQATRSTMHDSFKPNFMLTPPGRVVFFHAFGCSSSFRPIHSGPWSKK
jgi:hypothetical protein